VRQRRDAALFPNYFGQTCYEIMIHTVILQIALTIHCQTVNIGKIQKLIFDMETNAKTQRK